MTDDTKTRIAEKTVAVIGQKVVKDIKGDSWICLRSQVFALVGTSHCD